MSRKKLQSELEGLHYTILEEWVDKGRTENLPEEMATYLEQLNFVNGLWNSCHTPQKIIDKLIITYPGLDKISAKSRFEDAVNWFYLDDQVKREAWRNLIFEKMLKLVDAAIISAVSVNDYNKASLMLQRAYLVKGLDKEEKEKIPEEAFQKPIKIYSDNVSDFEDLPDTTNRNILAQYVDQMLLQEDEKLRIKQEMGIEPKVLFATNEHQEED